MISDRLYNLLKEFPLNRRKAEYYAVKQKRNSDDASLQADLYKLSKYGFIEGSVKENYNLTIKGVNFLQDDVGERFITRKLFAYGIINLNALGDSKFITKFQRNEIIKDFIAKGWIEKISTTTYKMTAAFTAEKVKEYKRMALNQLTVIGNTDTITEWDDFRYLLCIPDLISDVLKNILDHDGYILLHKTKNGDTFKVT